MISFEEALEIVQASAERGKYGVIDIPIDESLGYVLAEDVSADRDYPPFNRSAMDGISIKAKSFQQQTYKVEDVVPAGVDYQKKVDTSKGCVKIMTGAKVPDDFDVVIPRELLCYTEDGFVTINSDEVKPYKNIARQGEDLSKNQLVFEKGTFIDENVISLLAVLGKHTIQVYRKPKVSIICTGDELVAVDEAPLPFQIRNSSLHFLKAALRKLGVRAEAIHVKDNPEKLRIKIKQSLEQADILLTTGGVSMGDKDFLPTLFEEVGVEKVFHKVAMKPGKPIWFGKKGDKVVFGLPGNPLSTQVGFTAFVKTYILVVQAQSLKFSQYQLSHDLQKREGMTFVFPCNVDGQQLTIKKFNGSGDITSVHTIDGFVKLDEQNKYEIGDVVHFLS